MPIARQRQVCPECTPYYHCVNRCVRRAFLCGDDALTGRSFAHRKRWIEEQFTKLSAAFAIEVCAYAVMDNHYHVVLKLCRVRAENWAVDEVHARWYQLFKGHPLIDRCRRGEVLTEAELSLVRSLTRIWRERLTELSWFMRCLNEAIARRANAEDGCKGRFWEGRFKSQALLDETALLTCLSYVDLNPIRAGAAPTPETSVYTSIFQRIRALQVPGRHQPADSLTPFQTDRGGDSDRCLPCNLQDYLELVDWAGHAILTGKRGSIGVTAPGILTRLGVEAGQWLDQFRSLGRRPRVAVGARDRLRRFAGQIGQAWIWGCGRGKGCLGYA